MHKTAINHMRKSSRFAGVSVSVLTYMLLAANAANASSIPGSADASRFQGRVERTAPQSTSSAPLKVEGTTLFQAPAGAENLKFTLQGIEIEGLSVYTPSEIQSLYASKIGTNVSLAEIYAIASELTKKYRNDGYILTQVVVPPQTIASGTVKLRVVEGKVNKVQVQGDVLGQSSLISEYAKRLESAGALNNRELERDLLLINDLPGVTAQGVLSPSREVVGASDLTIFVERNPFDAHIGIDNYGSRYLGRWEATGNISANSLLGMNELLGLTLAYAPSDQGLEPELTFGEAMAQFPIGSCGTKLSFKLGVTQTEPGAGLDEFDIKGHAKYAGVEIEHPIVRTRDFNITSTLGFDLRSTKTKSNVDFTRIDDLSVVRLGGHMDWVDTAINAAVTNIDLEVSQGVSWFGASDEGDSNISRPAGDPQFTKVTASVSRLERVINNVALKTSIMGQMSDSPLLSAEEFGVGGGLIGRGYDPSELVGDDGFGASLEVQWSNPFQQTIVSDYTLYGFYDFGRVWNDDASTADGRAESLASIGLGIRATIMPGTYAGFMLAKPLTRDIQSENDDDIRPFVNISHKF
ncbi:MAG TPA: ShlB/FhaC/HecB family hemolysin secretion/activation protein [Alphaproteobacteria bacterium]|nr:ShlB/FhaC/HecB family hemolysin secretion/activation protein [Alphaproteobacteria bacterium]